MDFNKVNELFEAAISDPKNAEVSCVGFDNLMSYIRDNGKLPAVNDPTFYERASKMSNSTLAQTQAFKDDPSILGEDLYAIVLCKLILVFHKCVVDPGKINTFTWFHATYGKLIMQGLYIMA